MSLEELWFVWILKDNLTLGNEINNNVLLGIQLDKGLLLPLNELIDIFHAGGSNVTGGGEHDAVKELNMGLQLVTVGVALPVQVNHHLGLHHHGDQLLMLLDGNVEEVVLLFLLGLGPLGHQDLENLVQPFLNLGTLQIFAKRMEVVPLPLELGGGVHLVRHDARDGLFYVLHPLGHLGVAHVVDILDEGVVLLPERHLLAVAVLISKGGNNLSSRSSAGHSPSTRPSWCG